jgi:hypothetical protein
MRASLYFLCAILPLGSSFLSLPKYQTHRLSTIDLTATYDDSDGTPSRRDFLQAGGLALSSLLVSGLLPNPAVAGEPKTIVLTGGNSGESLLLLDRQEH